MVQTLCNQRNTLRLATGLLMGLPLCASFQISPATFSRLGVNGIPNDVRALASRRRKLPTESPLEMLPSPSAGHAHSKDSLLSSDPDATSSSTKLSASSLAIPFNLDITSSTIPFNFDIMDRVYEPSTTTVSATEEYKVFCDLDGVLVDFEAGVQAICNQPTNELTKSSMWKYVSSVDGFFEKLDWTRDGPELWKAIRHLSPDILTGIPDLESSRQEKFRWCKQNLGLEEEGYHHVDMAGSWYRHVSTNGNKVQDGICNVITCWSYNKHHHSGSNRILIDDRIALKKAWEAKGGIFVHHTHLESTLQQLRQLGVLE